MLDPRYKVIARICYLIEQQASHALIVGIRKQPSYQPILFGEDGQALIELSREQALAAATQLRRAAMQVDDPGDDIEYPGKVIRVD